ncbi:MAG: hypothetical protein PHC45_00920 [Clostridiaceae bacterium]|nr:hypothetical protein [Clostridiaceae bacterium]
MIWVGILGAKGYLGESLSKLIAGHQSAQVSIIHDFQNLSESVCCNCGSIEKSTGYLSMANAINKSDIIFNGFSGTMAEDIYSKALSKGKKIINIGDPYPGNGAYPGSVYGLSELYKDKMRDIPIAANPSSYCTGAVLGLAPLAEGNIIDINTVVIESKSGISCLRCGDKLACTDSTVSNGINVYKMDCRDYAEEVNIQMFELFGKNAAPSYTSYVIPGVKGIITKIIANPYNEFCRNDILGVYREFYKLNPLIEVCDADTINEAGKGPGNCFCRISASSDKNTGNITVTTMLDDAIRGYASQAIQTMNLMYGIDGKTGL